MLAYSSAKSLFVMYRTCPSIVFATYRNRLYEALHSIEPLDSRGSYGDCFKGDPQLVRGRHREIQLLKADDSSGPVFHQNDLIPRFFTHVFLLRIPKPYGQGIPRTVMENLYLLHTRSPSLI